jgi:hypothetical protein
MKAGFVGSTCGVGVTVRRSGAVQLPRRGVEVGFVGSADRLGACQLRLCGFALSLRGV